jgi:nondiscriminating aspartyl-tRNA synthetase
MERVLVKDVRNWIGQEILVKGWVHRIREMGKVNFVLLRDRSGFLQLVFNQKPDFTLESVLSVTGLVKVNEKAPGGAELEVASVELLSMADPELPIPVNLDPDKHNIDALLDNRIIALRNPKIRSIFELQSAILRSFSEVMHREGFYEMKTSKLIGSGTEGGTGLFSVDYFDTKVYLAQSPQFYKQAMISTGLERVFEISHAYRAEKHDTPRHLNEYVSFDVEMAFIDSELDLINFERRLLEGVFSRLGELCPSIFSDWDSPLPEKGYMNKVPLVDHDEAKDIIGSELGKKVFEIAPEGERALCDWAQKKHGVDAVFINGWPRKKRPFYTYPKDQKTMSFDLIFRGLEITTGGRRINDYQMLLETLPKFGMTEQGLEDYLTIFKYGCPPHGGFAIGVERLTQKLLGIDNVKMASPFPRDRRRVRP